jgi:hypothetical protein
MIVVTETKVKGARMKSLVSVAKLAEGGYSVQASGTYGGGWTQQVKVEELASTLIRAYQMYGTNKEGISYTVPDDVPDNIREMVNTLEHGDSRKFEAILLRLTDPEAAIIRQTAESEGKSINQWCREKLLK